VLVVRHDVGLVALRERERLGVEPRGWPVTERIRSTICCLLGMSAYSKATSSSAMTTCGAGPARSFSTSMSDSNCAWPSDARHGCSVMT
jgi:hypothetical protein